ncbi:unnamed protein product [Dovyalis caffra]|uniref:Phorbol-ester/DAG-type domain-containing protein n=1 Tax=Dovyalis caffra TaxID=77055 RepID=A0AAV1RMW5_9ROSI|nr:unnamed protein product [Dovyalis caffra]
MEKENLGVLFQRETKMEYRGFLHEHPLMLNEETIVGTRCDACGEFFQGLVYTCSECGFNIHKSCAELPREFQNPYHPLRLSLVTDEWEGQAFRCLWVVVFPAGYVENPSLVLSTAATLATTICIDHVPSFSCQQHSSTFTSLAF